LGLRFVSWFLLLIIKEDFVTFFNSVTKIKPALLTIRRLIFYRFLFSEPEGAAFALILSELSVLAIFINVRIRKLNQFSSSWLKLSLIL